MIKLVATDIDGTILIPNAKFTNGVRTCIKRLQNSGVTVVLVTGRMYAAAKLIADDLGLTTPIVSYQGGLVKSNQDTLYERYLTNEQTERVLNWAKTEGLHINLYNDDKLYSEEDCYEVQRYCDSLHMKYEVKDFCDIEKNKINKLLGIDYNSTEKIDR
ncbi:MAG: HAD family hydrolase, partial [bacterium]|nr:HAD family hydrolase [bacterium]